jgi:ABC-type phosphate/phosphonate transport system substrate-binding protein
MIKSLKDLLDKLSRFTNSLVYDGGICKRLKSKKIKKINDLKNKSIALKSDDYLSSIYLKKILSKENIIIENRDFFKDYNTVLLKTLFGSYDACIIPSYAYEILKELNPIINDKLVILEKTKEIFTNHLILFNKNYDSKKLIELENRIDIFKNTVKKEEIFSLLNIEDTFFVNIDELSNLHEFYLDYKNLPE